VAEGFRIASAFVDVHLNDDTKVDEAKLKERLSSGKPIEIHANVDVDTDKAKSKLNEVSVTGGRVFSPLVAAGIAAGTILGGPLALGAIPVIFGGIAAVIVAQNQEIKDDFKDLGQGVVSELKSDTQVLVPYFHDISDQISSSFQSVRPELQGIFGDLGPELTTLTGGVLSFAENAMPGFVAAIHTGQPVVQGLSDLLAKTGTGLSGFFTELSSGSASAGQVFSQLGDIFEQVLPVVGHLLTVFSGMASGALPVFGGSLSLVLGLLDHLLSALGPIAPLLGTITGGVGSAVGAFKLFGMVGGGIESVGTKISGAAEKTGVMVSAAGKVEGALTKVGNALPIVGAAFVATDSILSSFGVSMNDAVSQIMAGTTSFDQLDQKSRDTYTGFGLWLNGFLGFTTTGEQARGEIDKMRAGMSGLQLAQSLATQAQGDYARAVSQFGENSLQAVAAQGNLADATDKVERAQTDAANATKSFTDRVIEQTNILSGAANADVAYQQSLLQVKDAQKAADDASRQYGSTSQQTQSAVLSLEQQVLSAAEAAQRKAAADTASLGPQAQARAGSDAYASTLVNLAAQANGPARDALLGYVARLDDSQLAAISANTATSGFGSQVLQLPGGKTVTISANTGAALAAIGGVQGALNGLRDRYVNVVVNTVQNIAAGIPHAQGGVFRPMAAGGVLTAVGYAGGGMRSMRADRPDLVPPGDLRIIGDNQKFTELFAPLDGSKQSLSYIRYGANTFGYDLTSTGSSSTGSSSVAGGDRVGSSGGTHIAQLNLNIANNLDPTNPVAWRTAVENLRTALRSVERSYA
jgi:hypothetical protein